MLRSKFHFALATAALAFMGSSSVSATESGLAAVYTNRLHGHTTACGEIYDKNKLTTAHQTLPCGSKVKIINPENGKSVVLRVNDRGPTQEGRIVDISMRAAKALGMRHAAMIPVELKVLKRAK